MKITPVWIVFVLSSFVASVLSADPAQMRDPAADEPWPFEVSDLEPDPEVHWGQLENGTRYAIMPNREPRDRVSLRLFVRAGSLQEREHQRGLAHYLEHMAFNGTENFGPGTLVEYFQRLGMAFGADTNAYTAFDRTVYMIELPDTERSSLDEGLLVLRDFASRMLIEEDEVESERGVILSEMRARDSVGFRTAVAEFNFLLPESIIPDRFPIGADETIRAATRDDLEDFYDAWYRPGRTGIIVTGEIDPETVEELITEHFADFEPRGAVRAEPDLGEVVSEDVRAKLHTEREAQTTRVAIQTVRPYTPEPDTVERRLERLRRSVANEMINRRLERLARQEDAPFSRGSTAAYEVFDFLTNASIELHGEPEDWEDALRTAEVELRRALVHGFHPAELREVTADLRNSFEEAVRRAPTRRSPDLAEAIVRSISDRSVFTSPEDELELMAPALEALSVEECLAALRETWDEEGRFLFVTGNVNFEEPEERILAVFEESRANEVEPMDEIADLEFAYTDFGEAGEIVEREHIEDLDIHQVRFANGVRLNVKRTDFESNTIRARARVGSGRLTEPEELEGVAVLADKVFTVGGLGEHSIDDLRRILAGRNAGVNFGVSDDAFVFSGSTTPADLDLQLQLMTAYLSDPGYRPEALREAHNNLRELYRAARHTAQGVLGTQVSRYLARGDHRFGLPEQDKVFGLDLDAVREWLAEPLASGYLELTLLGDLDVDEAISAAAATVGALPAREEAKPELSEYRAVSFPEGEERADFPFVSDIPSGYAAVYWPTTDTWDIQRTRRLTVLARVFSDRMRIRIREEMGEAYSPYAVSQPSDTYDDYGLFFGLVGIDPEKAEEVAEVVLEIAADVHKNGITDDELDRAIRPILTSVRTAVRDNGYWMNSVLASSQEHPQRIEWARTMIEDFEEVSRDEVEELAGRFLDPDEALEVFVIPVVDEAEVGAGSH